MSAEISSDLHPVLAAVAGLERALASVADVEPAYMRTEDKGAALLRLSAALDRAEELRMRIMHAAGDVAAAEGARDVAAWLTHHGRRNRAECRHRLRLADTLAAHEQVASALREGRANLAQADVIVRAVDALRPEVDEADPGIRSAAEERLLQEAQHFGPRKLGILARRVVDVVAPEVAEGIEGRLLEQEAARAARRTYLTSRPNGDGTTDIRMRVSDAACARLLTYLEAFTNPRREGSATGTPASPPDDRRPYPQRLGAAFVAFLEAVDPSRLPLHGGDATTVMVTIDFDALRERLGRAVVGDQPITAAHARRLACTAGILPVVLGGESQVLDLGRTRRLFSPAQRKALALRYPTCAVVGCEVPAPWTEAHHATQDWARGGRTDLDDGVLVCSFHHHRAHDPRYRTQRHPGGSITLHRRT